MKLKYLVWLGMLTSTSVLAVSSANETLLSSPFPIYTDGVTAVNQPAPGFTEAPLPVDNSFAGNPGCYIACYSHNKNIGLYSAGTDIYAVGMIRVAGQYQDRICQPMNFENQDISALQSFKDLCNNQIPNCKGSECWAGGDTGGWVGIP